MGGKTGGWPVKRRMLQNKTRKQWDVKFMCVLGKQKRAMQRAEEEGDSGLKQGARRAMRTQIDRFSTRGLTEKCGALNKDKSRGFRLYSGGTNPPPSTE